MRHAGARRQAAPRANRWRAVCEASKHGAPPRHRSRDRSRARHPRRRSPSAPRPRTPERRRLAGSLASRTGPRCGPGLTCSDLAISDLASTDFASTDFASSDFASFDFASFDFASSDFISSGFSSSDFASFDFASFDFASFDFASAGLDAGSFAFAAAASVCFAVAELASLVAAHLAEPRASRTHRVRRVARCGAGGRCGCRAAGEGDGGCGLGCGVWGWWVCAECRAGAPSGGFDVRARARCDGACVWPLSRSRRWAERLDCSRWRAGTCAGERCARGGGLRWALGAACRAGERESSGRTRGRAR